MKIKKINFEYSNPKAVINKNANKTSSMQNNPDLLYDKLQNLSNISFASLKINSKFTGEKEKTTSSGEKFKIQFEDGEIKSSTRTNENGEIVLKKEYCKDKYDNKIVSIYIPKDDGALELSKKILTGKDRVIIYKNDNEIEQYWFRTPKGFKRVDEFIDKGDVENYRQAQNYYSYNGIQINAFLRDGEFRHPNITYDEIPYEILNDPDAYEWEKNEIKDIMTDNRFILDIIDEIDVLTKQSKTDEDMIVYRNAPIRWVKNAKDGILDEAAFVSTSTEKGASMEGIYVGKDRKVSTTYKIHLPKGTPFYDLTHTSEKEMLLPRKAKFRVIGDTELEYILPAD